MDNVPTGCCGVSSDNLYFTSMNFTMMGRADCQNIVSFVFAALRSRQNSVSIKGFCFFAEIAFAIYLFKQLFLVHKNILV